MTSIVKPVLFCICVYLLPLFHLRVLATGKFDSYFQFNEEYCNNYSLVHCMLSTLHYLCQIISYIKCCIIFLFCFLLLYSQSIGKGKSVPLQAWSGPEGSRKLRFPDFMTTAQDGGKVVSLTHRPLLPPGNPPGTHFCLRLSRPQGHSAIGRILCQ